MNRLLILTLVLNLSPSDQAIGRPIHLPSSHAVFQSEAIPAASRMAFRRIGDWRAAEWARRLYAWSGLRQDWKEANKPFESKKWWKRWITQASNSQISIGLMAAQVMRLYMIILGSLMAWLFPKFKIPQIRTTNLAATLTILVEDLGRALIIVVVMKILSKSSSRLSTKTRFLIGGTLSVATWALLHLMNMEEYTPGAAVFYMGIIACTGVLQMWLYWKTSNLTSVVVSHVVYDDSLDVSDAFPAVPLLGIFTPLLLWISHKWMRPAIAAIYSRLKRWRDLEVDFGDSIRNVLGFVLLSVPATSKIAAQYVDPFSAIGPNTIVHSLALALGFLLISAQFIRFLRRQGKTGIKRWSIIVSIAYALFMVQTLYGLWPVFVGTADTVDYGAFAFIKGNKMMAVAFVLALSRHSIKHLSRFKKVVIHVAAWIISIWGLAAFLADYGAHEPKAIPTTPLAIAA